MSILNLALVPALLWASAGFAQSVAHADIVDSQGKKIGSAAFRASDNGLRIDVNVLGLPPGTHGIHIHSVGKCEVRHLRAQAHISIRPRRNMGKITRKGHTLETDL